MTVRITAHDGVTPTLRVWVARLRRMDPALKRVGHYVTELSRQAFKDEADPVTGQPWPRLKPATLKRRRGVTAAILQDTRELYKSIHYLISGRRSVTIGAAAVHGWYHQDPKPESHNPQRRHLGIDARAHRRIGEIVLAYVEKGKR